MSDSSFEDVTRARIIVKNCFVAGGMDYSDMVSINTLIDDFDACEQANAEGRLIRLDMPDTSDMNENLAMIYLSRIEQFGGLTGKAIESIHYAISILQKVKSGQLREVIQCGECKQRENRSSCIHYFGATIPESGRMLLECDDFCSGGIRKDTENE